MFRDKEATLSIRRDKTADQHYLMLSELGRVLQELREDLPGALCSPAKRLGMLRSAIIEIEPFCICAS